LVRRLFPTLILKDKKALKFQESEYNDKSNSSELIYAQGSFHVGFVNQCPNSAVKATADSESIDIQVVHHHTKTSLEFRSRSGMKLIYFIYLFISQIPRQGPDHWIQQDKQHTKIKHYIPQ
jgi:hypothetical protein